MKRTLISDNGTTKVWQITDDAGNVIGTDETLTPSTTVANEGAIRQAAANALAANRAYIASTPTAAQVAAQSKALTRQMNGVIRLLLNALDGTD